MLVVPKNSHFFILNNEFASFKDILESFLAICYHSVEIHDTVPFGIITHLKF